MSAKQVRLLAAARKVASKNPVFDVLLALAPDPIPDAELVTDYSYGTRGDVVYLLAACSGGYCVRVGAIEDIESRADGRFPDLASAKEFVRKYAEARSRPEPEPEPERAPVPDDVEPDPYTGMDYEFNDPYDPSKNRQDLTLTDAEAMVRRSHETYGLDTGVFVTRLGKRI